jgi:hypothetical protein
MIDLCYDGTGIANHMLTMPNLFKMIVKLSHCLVVKHCEQQAVQPDAAMQATLEVL